MNEEKQKQLESIADRLLEKAAEMNSLANEIYRLIGTGRIDDLANGGNSIKISIEATPQEIAELLQAITSSQKQKEILIQQQRYPISVEEKFANWEKYKRDYDV